VKKRSNDTSKVKKARAKRTRKPKHAVETRAFCFPLDVPTKAAGKLLMVLAACWRLRNNLVQDRDRNRLSCKVQKQLGRKALYLNRADQYASISNYVRMDTALSMVHSQVRQNVAVRVDEGYKRFFEAVKEGRSSVHPPHYIDFKKYRSFTFPQYGTAAHITRGRVYLSGIGDFRIYDYRKVKGKPKTLTVKFKQGRWWCIVTTEAQAKDVIQPVIAPEAKYSVGIDTGLSKLMTDSFGLEYDPPKAWMEARARLAAAGRKMSRMFRARENSPIEAVELAKASGAPAPSLREVPYSHRLRAQIRKVARIHAKVDRIRDYYHKKNASVIADRYNLVAVEEHGVNFMIRNKRQAKLASDRAIHKQKLLLKSKLGHRYIKADASCNGMGNSQVCVCGASVPKELNVRIHSCPSCGTVSGRDHMSANVVSVNVFGFASTSLRAPVTGLVIVRRGGSETPVCESRQSESGAVYPASKVPMKRQPLVQRRHTTGAEATVAGKTPVHRRGPRQACSASSSLPGEPKTTTKRARRTLAPIACTRCKAYNAETG
jgi:putative transposase